MIGKRILVIGCPGSGKSYLSSRLSKATSLPLIHLDMLYWNSDKTPVERELFLSRLQEALSEDEWIIDGNYISTMELRMKHCDTVIFLDFPTELCLQGLRERRGKPRTDMPWIETEEDKEFTDFVRSFNSEQRPKVLKLLEAYSYVNQIVLNDRTQLHTFIEDIIKNNSSQVN